MSIHILCKKISRAELKTIAQESFEVMVKAVVDVEKGILALGGELHADANAALLDAWFRAKTSVGNQFVPG